MEFPKGLSTTEKDKLQSCISFVKESLAQAESGHDWWHIVRVWNTAMHLASKYDCHIFIVGLGVLFHDIADPKFHDGDKQIGAQKTEIFLKEIKVEKTILKKVIEIVRFSSFSSRNELINPPDYIEFQIVQDADRLDAMGAIGIARAFNYGGYKNNPLYLPEISDYEKNTSTIQHFHDKLFHLKELMNTSEAKIIAEERHDFMLTFINKFKNEWEGLA